MQEIKVVMREYKNAKKGDILVYDGEKWQPISSVEFLKEINAKLAKVDVLQQQIVVLKRQIAGYLKEDLK